MGVSRIKKRYFPCLFRIFKALPELKTLIFLCPWALSHLIFHTLPGRFHIPFSSQYLSWAADVYIHLAVDSLTWISLGHLKIHMSKIDLIILLQPNLLPCSILSQKMGRVEKLVVLKSMRFGTSLVVQWLRIYLAVQRMLVQSLVWEHSTCRAAKPMCHKYWACTLELWSHNYGACAPMACAPQ